MKNIHVMSMIFGIIKHFVVFYCKNYYKIEKVEKISSKKEYLIHFFSDRDRRKFVKTPSEIMKDKNLIIKFAPSDAMSIGMYMAETINK